MDRRRQVPHGRRTLLSGGAAGPSGAVDGFWIDEHPVTNGEFSAVREGTGHVTWAERTPDPSTYPEAIPEHLVPGSVVFQQPGHASAQRSLPLVGLGSRRLLAASRGPGHHAPRARSTLSCTWRTRTRRRTPLGRQGAPHRGRVGVRGPGRPRRARSSPGVTSRAAGTGDGEHVAGQLSGRNDLLDGFMGTSPVGRSRRTGTASSTWPATCGSGPTTGSRRTRAKRHRRRAAPRATRA